MTIKEIIGFGMLLAFFVIFICVILKRYGNIWEAIKLALIPLSIVVYLLIAAFLITSCSKNTDLSSDGIRFYSNLQLQGIEAWRFAVKRQHNSNTDFKLGFIERVNIDDSTWIRQDGLPAPMQRDLFSFHSFNPFDSFVSVESWLPVRDRSPSPGFSEAQVVRTRLKWASENSTFEQREMLGLYLFEAFPPGIFKLSDVNEVERILANQEDLREVSARDWDLENHRSTFILNAGIVVVKGEFVDVTWYVINVWITYRGKIGKVYFNPIE